MKKWSWLVVLALGSAHAQDFPQKVSYTADGGSLRTIISDLALKNKLPLAVSAKIADNEIVSIRVADVSVTDLVKRIALVTDGTWSLSGTTWTLEPDMAKREAQRLAKRAQAIKSLRENLARILAPPKAPPVDPKTGKKAEVDPEEDMAYSQSDKLMANLVSRVDLGVIADIPDNGRIVFSNSPTRMQRALNIPNDIVAIVVKEHNDEVDAQASAKQEEAVDADMQKYEELRKRFGGGEHKLVKVTEPPVKALLVLERGGMFGDYSITCELKVYGQQGNTLATKQMSLSTGEMPGRFSDFASDVKPSTNDTPPVVKVDPKSTKIVRGEIGSELIKLTQRMSAMFMGGGDSKTELSPKLLEGLLHPEAVDPLSYLAGELLTQTATDRKLNLVAVLPDNIANDTMSGTSLNTCDEVYRMVKISEDWDMKEENGWWMLTAKDPLAMRKQRSDRPSLGQFCRENQGQPSVRLDSLAKYASRNNPPTTTPLSAMFLMLVAPSAMQYMYDEHNWGALQLYGSLEPAQLALLQGGQTIPLSSLSGSSARFAQQMIFGADPQIVLGAPKEDETTGGLLGAMMIGLSNAGLEEDYRQEPTEVLPNGLTQGFLALPAKSDYAFKLTGAGMLSMLGSTGIMELAMYRMMGESMKGQPAGAAMPEIKTVKMGTRRTLKMTLQLTADAAVRASLTDDQFDKDGKDIALDNLPAEVKNRLDAMIADIKKMNLPFLDPSMFQNRQVIPPR